jgi:hypothetical protein
MDNSEMSKGPIKRVEGAEQPLGSITGLTPDMAIKSLRLMKAKAEADEAEYKRRHALQQFRPCKMYPIVIYHDGMRWVCSLGVMPHAYKEYLPDSAMGESGVEAFGDYPEQAMQNFDAMWLGTLAEDLADSTDDNSGDDR